MLAPPPAALYWVCHDCAHTWLAPEDPDHCENCRAHGSNLEGFPLLEDAEDASQDILVSHMEHGR